MKINLKKLQSLVVYYYRNVLNIKLLYLIMVLIIVIENYNYNNFIMHFICTDILLDFNSNG